MSRIQNILEKAEREGASLRTTRVGVPAAAIPVTRRGSSRRASRNRPTRPNSPIHAIRNATAAPSELKPAAIGLFGIDNLHEVHSELHPLYAIAIRIEASPSRQRWVAFARRGGMEGECGSRLEHAIDAKRLVLPLHAAAGSWDGVRGEFYDHGLPVPDWKVYAGTDAPSLVLPLADKPCTVVEGEITLERGGGATGAALVAGEPPVSEPMLWNSVPRAEEWCHEEDWFREVP